MSVPIILSRSLGRSFGSSGLIGPPSLYLKTTAAATSSGDPFTFNGDPLKTTAATSSGDQFMDLMTTNFNTAKLPPMMGYTENHSPTFLSTGNPCLDFFFHIVPYTPSEEITRRLDLSWSHNSPTTLKLICNLRGVRGTGKSDTDGFYTAADWLHRNHPKTLACNVGSVAGFGYFKDLPEILFRLLEGQDVRKNQKSEWLARKGVKEIGSKRNVAALKAMAVWDSHAKKELEKSLRVSEAKKVRVISNEERKAEARVARRGGPRHL